MVARMGRDQAAPARPRAHKGGKGAPAAPPPQGMRIEYEGIRKLTRWPRNPRTHDHLRLKQLIREFGFWVPLIFDEGTGRLVAGHGRDESLILMWQEDPKHPPKGIRVGADGEWLVPVVRGQAFESEAEAERFLLAVNRSEETLGGWDNSMLLEMLDSHRREDDVSVLGWTEDQIAEIRVSLGRTRVSEHDRSRTSQTSEESQDASRKTHVCQSCGASVACDD